VLVLSKSFMKFLITPPLPTREFEAILITISARYRNFTYNAYPLQC
jgi:hypothetical protein